MANTCLEMTSPVVHTMVNIFSLAPHSTHVVQLLRVQFIHRKSPLNIMFFVNSGIIYSFNEMLLATMPKANISTMVNSKPLWKQMLD